MTTTVAAILGAIGASVVWLAVCWRLLNQRDTARWESAHLRVQPAHLRVQPAHLKRHHDGDPEAWRNYSRRLPGDTHYDGPGEA